MILLLVVHGLRVNSTWKILTQSVNLTRTQHGFRVFGVEYMFGLNSC